MGEARVETTRSARNSLPPAVTRNPSPFLATEVTVAPVSMNRSTGFAIASTRAWIPPFRG